MEMVLQQKQKQIQALNLVMTPALRQAIELLQYSTYELYDYLLEQALDNPLLDLKEKDDNSFRAHENSRHRNLSHSLANSLDWIAEDEVNMRDKLVQQASLQFKRDKDICLLKYLIYNLDDNGYLQLTQDRHELNYDEKTITYGVQLLQQIGPIGIGAKNLKECLLIQLTYHYPTEKLAYQLIHEHFDLLTTRKWDDIAKQMKISLAEVKNLYEFIKKLNPKPCTMITDFKTEYITPDIVIELVDDQLAYYLNDSYLPAIQVNHDYLAMRNKGTEVAQYINDQQSQIHWLVNSIEKRRMTISKIVEVLLNKQHKFFQDGFIALQPLTLKEVADAIDMHESTVSRATANKMIQTPKGTFNLRMLFTSKLDTADGDAISQTKVKTLLQRFIKDENKFKPLSDQKIAEFFNKEAGITISRRTISKYREELNIPSSRMRKEILA